jgi:large subunit ribosomal protein L31
LLVLSPFKILEKGLFARAKKRAILLSMKTETHPTYFPEAKVTCACGRSFTVGSTSEKIEVEICSNCHPFYTGNDKLMDTAGRVEKFKARKAAAGSKKSK